MVAKTNKTKFEKKSGVRQDVYEKDGEYFVDIELSDDELEFLNRETMKHNTTPEELIKK